MGENTATPLSSENKNNIKLTHLSNGYVVSTIELSEYFMRLDIMLAKLSKIAELDRVADLSEPGFYETMVFHADSDGEIIDWDELDFARYDTVEEALKGHNDLVTKWLVV